MAQPGSHEQLSVQEVPNILKVARQDAALGLYVESIKSYKHAMHVLLQHTQTVADPFLKGQWKKTDDEVKSEVEAVYSLYKSLKVLRNPAAANKDRHPPPEEPRPRQHDERVPFHPGEPPQSMMEHFGGPPFVPREFLQPAPAAREAAEPPAAMVRKDPVIWDPPEPRFQPPKKAQKKLPKWAQANPQKPHGKPGKHPTG